jgi:hypothetical protein
MRFTIGSTGSPEMRLPDDVDKAVNIVMGMTDKQRFTMLCLLAGAYPTEFIAMYQDAKERGAYVANIRS